MGRDLYCTAGKRISDHYVLILEGEMEKNCCVLQEERLVIFVW
jgi:hypothetical protein